MKIVFLSYLQGFGGAERQNVMLANAMAERGHDITLVSLCADNNCYELDEKVKYIFLPDRKNGIGRLITRYQDIKKVLQEVNPDIILNFWLQPAYMTAMMKKSINGKIIYSERGDPGDKEYSGILGIVRKLALSRIDGFVFQSKGAQSYFDKDVQKRSTVIHNPVIIKMNAPHTVKHIRKAIVSVGRLHPQKNQKVLIEAFAKISDRIPDYRLEIYGDGELKEELENLIKKLSIDNKAFLMGTSKKIHSLICDASLFVLSSDFEGMPNALLEAMALGLPCISTDCKPGGARELITNDTEGAIVPINNSDALAKSILQLIGDEKLRNKIGRTGKQRAEAFRPDIIYSAWEDFFIQTLRGIN